MPKHSKTSAQNATNDETEETNGNNKKIEIIANRRFFCEILWGDNGCGFFCVFRYHKLM